LSVSAPKFVRPCVPTTAKAIPRGNDWLHEPKLDGYRFQVVKDGLALRLYSRRLASLAEALTGLLCTSAVIDGELVFPAANGSPDFYRLQSAMVPGRQHELAVFAFDLLHHNGEDLRSLTLIDRRLQLAVARSNVRCLHLVWGFDNGAKLLEAAERHGLEGIVSKRARAPYRSGPSRDWVKVKTAGWRAANRERWRLFEKR
jgi:bifunctional non-homologous end joining protein LigD